jgi:uridine kinase
LFLSPPFLFDRHGFDSAPALAPFVIGVCGGTASGKTTVCDLIVQDLADQRVCVVSQDSFYRALTEEEKELANAGDYNFDHPDAFDWECLRATVEKMLAARPGDVVEIPVYDFATHSRLPETRVVHVGDVVILEGIMIFYDTGLRALLNMLIFVDTDDDLRLARRIRRDVADRGRTVEGVLDQYARHVKPSFDEFILPTKKYADVILPYVRQNQVGIDVIVQHIHSKLQTPNLRKLYTNLYQLPTSAQVLSLQTIIRDAGLSRDEFVFYSDRLIRLLIEEALGHLPFTERTVTTPTGGRFVGVRMVDPEHIVGISMVRAGEAQERALRDVLRNVSIGKVLIERKNGGTGPPEITYCKLPPRVSERWVIIMDPVIATGRSIIACVQRLIEEGVCPPKIIIACLFAAPEGVKAVCGAYPHIKFVVANIDHGVNDEGKLMPGIGDFADRYFGTD